MSLDAALAELNEICRADGAELVLRDATSTRVRLELDLSQSSCPECVVPRELLLEILRAHLDVEDIELHDPREDDGYVGTGH